MFTEYWFTPFANSKVTVTLRTSDNFIFTTNQKMNTDFCFYLEFHLIPPIQRRIPIPHLNHLLNLAASANRTRDWSLQQCYYCSSWQWFKPVHTHTHQHIATYHYIIHELKFIPTGHESLSTGMNHYKVIKSMPYQVLTKKKKKKRVRQKFSHA